MFAVGGGFEEQRERGEGVGAGGGDEMLCWRLHVFTHDCARNSIQSYALDAVSLTTHANERSYEFWGAFRLPVAW